MLDNILITGSDNTIRVQMVVYANQWPFRSTKKITHNTYFYFNKCSLDDSELV